MHARDVWSPKSRNLIVSKSKYSPICVLAEMKSKHFDFWTAARCRVLSKHNLFLTLETVCVEKKLLQNTLYDNPQRLGLPVKGVENLQNAEK